MHLVMILRKALTCPKSMTKLLIRMKVSIWWIRGIISIIHLENVLNWKSMILGTRITYRRIPYKRKIIKRKMVWTKTVKSSSYWRRKNRRKSKDKKRGPFSLSKPTKSWRIWQRSYRFKVNLGRNFWKVTGAHRIIRENERIYFI